MNNLTKLSDVLTALINDEKSAEALKNENLYDEYKAILVLTNKLISKNLTDVDETAVDDFCALISDGVLEGNQNTKARAVVEGEIIKSFKTASDIFRNTPASDKGMAYLKKEAEVFEKATAILMPAFLENAITVAGVDAGINAETQIDNQTALMPNHDGVIKFKKPQTEEVESDEEGYVESDEDELDLFELARKFDDKKDFNPIPQISDKKRKVFEKSVRKYNDKFLYVVNEVCDYVKNCEIQDEKIYSTKLARMVREFRRENRPVDKEGNMFPSYLDFINNDGTFVSYDEFLNSPSSVIYKSLVCEDKEEGEKKFNKFVKSPEFMRAVRAMESAVDEGYIEGNGLQDKVFALYVDKNGNLTLEKGEESDSDFAHPDEGENELVGKFPKEVVLVSKEIYKKDKIESNDTSVVTPIKNKSTMATIAKASALVVLVAGIAVGGVLGYKKCNEKTPAEPPYVDPVTPDDPKTDPDKKPNYEVVDPDQVRHNPAEDIDEPEEEPSEDENKPADEPENPENPENPDDNKEDEGKDETPDVPTDDKINEGRKDENKEDDFWLE